MLLMAKVSNATQAKEATAVNHLCTVQLTLSHIRCNGYKLPGTPKRRQLHNFEIDFTLFLLKCSAGLQ